MHDYLKKIIEAKKNELDELYRKIEDGLAPECQQLLAGDIKRELTKSFSNALAAEGVQIIAEIKRQSPSKNHLADIKDPVGLAQEYVKGGAAAISVLTDHFGFNGSLDDLSAVASVLKKQPTPVLRKDFLLDPAQIAEAIVCGADAVLLIVTVLGDKTASLLAAAQAMNIEALVEVHNRDELELAKDIGASIIGVNNRNLTTFETNIHNATDLFPHIPEQSISVAASGIHTSDVAQHYAHLGYDGLLIGEALVQSISPGSLISKFKGQ